MQRGRTRRAAEKAQSALGLTVIALVVIGCSSQIVVPTPSPMPPVVPSATATISATALPIPVEPTSTVAPSTPLTSPASSAAAVIQIVHSGDPSHVLLRLSDTSCGGFLCDPTVVVFALYGDGRAFFRSGDAGAAGNPQVVQLDEAQVQALLAFAIDDGGLGEAPEGFTAFSAIPWTRFEIQTSALLRTVDYGTGLSRLLAGDPDANPGLERLATRLANFGSEVAGAATLIPSCNPSPLHTIPRNNVVAWDRPAWQRVTADVWASPVDALDHASRKGSVVGFPSMQSRLKVLWWVPLGDGHPLVVTATPINGDGFQATYTINADSARPDRTDRPSGLGPLPPGCYRFSVSIGAESGSIIDEVRL
jgi:hypothetical protein